MEAYNGRRYSAAGLPEHFVQDNLSFSYRGVLRGLHFQWPYPQGKLVSVLRGAVFDVAVDIRSGSATFGRWIGLELSFENKRQMYVPPGFAHGFQVISEDALFSYKCTEGFRAEFDRVVRWDDPLFGVDWPIDHPKLSSKDAAAPQLSSLQSAQIPSLE